MSQFVEFISKWSRDHYSEYFTIVQCTQDMIEVKSKTSTNMFDLMDSLASDITDHFPMCNNITYPEKDLTGLYYHMRFLETNYEDL